jgi:hypothetical protein
MYEKCPVPVLGPMQRKRLGNSLIIEPRYTCGPPFAFQ